MERSGKVPRLDMPSQSPSEQPDQEQARAFTRPVTTAAPSTVLPSNDSLPDAQPASCTRFAEGAVQCTTNPSLENCLFRLQSAYHVDFDDLANRIDFPVTVYDSIKEMTLEVIGESGKAGNRQLHALADRLNKLYCATEADTIGRADKNRLAFIVTVFLLEQKAQLAGASGSGLKSQSAPSVRREFFDRLQAERLGRCSAVIDNGVKGFFADHASLRFDLEGHEPRAEFSDLCFDDIPGAVASARLREKLMELSQQYGVNFCHFIEVMGDSKRRPGCVLQDPVPKAMDSIGRRDGCRHWPILPNDSYLDRNAKLVITVMNCFHNQEFALGDPHLIPSVMGERCPTEQVQESSTTDEKMAAVKNQFIQFLLSICSRAGRDDIANRVEEHINKHWPKALRRKSPDSAGNPCTHQATSGPSVFS